MSPQDSKPYLDPSDPDDARKLAELDDLFLRASFGDGQAVMAVCLAFAGELALEARAHADAAPDGPLHELLDALVNARLRFHPPPGRPLSWIRAVVRGFARRRARGERPNPRDTKGAPIMELTQLDRLYRRHIRSLTRMAFALLQDLDAAEDVVHDAFVQIDEALSGIVLSDAELLVEIDACVTQRCEEHLDDARPHSAVVRTLAPPTPPTPGAPVAAEPTPTLKKAA